MFVLEDIVTLLSPFCSILFKFELGGLFALTHVDGLFVEQINRLIQFAFHLLYSIFAKVRPV